MALATTLATIRSALVTLVSGVSGISGGAAQVHDYYRHVTDMRELEDLLTSTSGTNRVHVWMVRPAVENPLSLHKRGSCTDAIFRWEIHGFYGLKDTDASEKAFLDVACAVLDALLADLNLGGTVRFNDPDLGLPAMAEHDLRMFAGVLCHHVSISVGHVKQVEG